ncbi:MAG: RluA family pseudouridine synthase [Deltaproteobacteria bacterium]|nr:RluA family pseudouridine synthase [Deltaproteobacteria bacterium]
MQILYEDSDLIAINKPSGMPTHTTLDESRENLFSQVKKFLSQREQQEVYVGLHHRLDKDTSGVILLTKTKAANLWVSQLFAKHQIKKKYVAIVSYKETFLKKKWSVGNYLKDTRTKERIRKMIVVKRGGIYAETEFALLKKYSTVLLIEAFPKTGRMHQIRVHLAGCGLPILGDSLYGKKTECVPRCMLHAQSLVFFHPLLNKEITIVAPVPEDFKQALLRM